jgi:hypothetical protein
MNTVLKRSLMPVAGLVLVATLATGPGQEAPTPPQGFQLLDRLVTLMVKAVAPPGGGDIGPDVIALAKDLKAARQAKQVDDLFAVRYLRLLSGVRQALLMDPEVLYWPMYRSAMFDFVEERTGRAPEGARVHSERPRRRGGRLGRDRRRGHVRGGVAPYPPREPVAAGTDHQGLRR